MINNIIFDLSGTIFTPQEQLSPAYSLIVYMWGGHKTQTLLDTYALKILKQAYHNPDNPHHKSRLKTGEQVPELVSAWLAGEFSSRSALEFALNAYQHALQNNQIPADQNVRDLIKQNLELFFDPFTLASCMRIEPCMLTIIQSCAAKKTPLYILSNWDRESFEQLYQSPEGQKIFRYFDPQNIIISGIAGSLKPQKKIFEYFLARTTLNPETCIFIDDQPENIDAALAFGIASMRFSLESINTITTELSSLDLR
jgi:FMN phosphatase YigB (HAD superfamily)